MLTSVELVFVLIVIDVLEEGERKPTNFNDAIVM